MSIVDEERRSKLADILNKNFPFSHSYMLAIEEIEALFEKEKPKFIDIEKSYLCTKDFLLADLKLYTKGKIYSPCQTEIDCSTGVSSGYFTNDLGDREYRLFTDGEKPFFDYFEEIPD